MVIFIDTKILIDAAARRIPFCESSNSVLALCARQEITGFVSSRTFCDIFYILRKDMNADERKLLIKSLRNFLRTVIITNPIIDHALDNDNISDFEDAIQYACAETIGADYIITRNTKDFDNSDIKAITPDEFLEIMELIK